jgi:membrane protein DedA with SNARE-associated domain
MLPWLRSLLPDLPHYGYALIFIVVFLNNVGAPLPGETLLLGAGFVLGRAESSLWQPILASTLACFLGGVCAFWLGRHLGHSRIEALHWLHLTPKRREWPERIFKRYGAKVVFITRFIALFPPVVANLLAGTTTMPWGPFLFFDLMGSAAYAITYILVGFFFGKKWKLLEAWLGPTASHLILAGIALTVLSVMFRHSLCAFSARLFSHQGKRR